MATFELFAFGATFDELIFRVASSRKEAERIVTRPVYAHLADNLAGTQAYMAMEKVLKVQEDERYDLIRMVKAGRRTVHTSRMSTPASLMRL